MSEETIYKLNNEVVVIPTPTFHDNLKLIAPHTALYNEKYSQHSNPNLFYTLSGLEFIFLFLYNDGVIRDRCKGIFIENSTLGSTLKNKSLDAFTLYWNKYHLNSSTKQTVLDIHNKFPQIIQHLRSKNAAILNHPDFLLKPKKIQSFLSFIDKNIQPVFINKYKQLMEICFKNFDSDSNFQELFDETKGYKVYIKSANLKDKDEFSYENIFNSKLKKAKEEFPNNVDNQDLTNLQLVNHQLYSEHIFKNSEKSIFISIPLANPNSSTVYNSKEDISDITYYGQGVTFVYFELEDKITDNQILHLVDRIKSFIINSPPYLKDILHSYLRQTTNDINEDLKKIATKSAIAQVMARNSSHNIGSHVLNKLTGDLSSINIANFKNFKSSFPSKVFANTDKDRLDQISKFNNYIKCRMDYLSDITFGIPAMQITKRLNSEVLSDLDDVRLLLENISGLSNFEYSIQIISEINNGDEKETDPAIAMPNDILGCQAFYNIIENIIRNTAKHSDKKNLFYFEKPSKDSNKIQFIIRISVIEDENLPDRNDFYQVEIFDNVIISGEKEFGDDKKAEEEYLTDLNKKSDAEKNEALNNLTNLSYLVYSQNKKLNDSILKEEDNTLRSISLGLIEMEASACYLRKMDISNLESDDYQIDYDTGIKN